MLLLLDGVIAANSDDGRREPEMAFEVAAFWGVVSSAMLDCTELKLEIEKARLLELLLFRRCAATAEGGEAVGEGVWSMRSSRLAAVLPMVASRSSACTMPVAAASRT